MALPSSGPISLADIQAEFGGSNPINLSEYYAGGPYVSSGISGINGPIPSSGQISLWNFFGASASEIQTITAAQTSDKYGTAYGYGNTIPGSNINDGTFNRMGGATILGLYWYSVTNQLHLEINGSLVDSGWEQLTINGLSLARVSGNYSNNGSFTYYYWPCSNPMPTNGGVYQAVFV